MIPVFDINGFHCSWVSCLFRSHKSSVTVIVEIEGQRWRFRCSLLCFCSILFIFRSSLSKGTMNRKGKQMCGKCTCTMFCKGGRTNCTKRTARSHLPMRASFFPKLLSLSWRFALDLGRYDICCLKIGTGACRDESKLFSRGVQIVRNLWCKHGWTYNLVWNPPLWGTDAGFRDGVSAHGHPPWIWHWIVAIFFLW